MGWVRRNAERLLLGFSLALIAGASMVLYRSLEDDRQAERARQERFMRNAAFSVVDDLGAELFALVSTFSYDLDLYREGGGTVDRTVLSDTIRRYQNLARFPDLLENLACLEYSPDKTWNYAEWRSSGWSSGQRPAWAPELTIPNATTRILNPPTRLFSLEKPVMVLRLGRGNNPQPGQIVAVALRFSPEVVLGQVVPQLVRQRFAESQDAHPYKASVHNTALAEASPEHTPDWEEPLLPWTPFDGWFDYYVNRLRTLDRSRLAFERVTPRLSSFSEDLGTGWTLQVVRLPEGLDAEMAALQLRNVGYTSLFFIALVFGVGSFYWIAVRARRRAYQERTFLALVSHELKTPLAVVRSLAENLAGGLANDGDRPREYGEVMVQETERLSRMVGNVLALSAVQGGLSPAELAAVDLGEIVRERLARGEPSDPAVELEVRVHPGLPLVRAQPAALGATVDNLIGNAFHHGTRGEGPHRISVSVEPRKFRGRRGVELVVEDDGPGFTFWEGISFRRPFRRGNRAWSDQSPGSGLGLSLARTTARALGGRLTWSSRPGHRTQFSLWLREADG
jgi:signal transduction histidine kinase